MGLKEKLLKAGAPRSEIVSVGGVKIKIQEMTGADRDRLLKASMHRNKLDDDLWNDNLMIFSVRDPKTGERLLTTKDDLEELKKTGMHLLSVIESTALRLNGIGATEAEQAEKN